MAKQGVKTLPGGKALEREVRQAKSQSRIAEKYGVSRAAVSVALKKHRARMTS